MFPLQTLASHASQVAALPPVTGGDPRIGLDDVLPGSPAGSSATWASLAVAAGAHVDRWELRWDRIEPKRGHWNFTSDDSAVKPAVTAGMEVLGILIGTPKWAAAAGQKPGNGVPRGVNLPITDPHNLWARYVRATVQHYAGQIHEWEIWNEPDLSFFWSGSAADYATLLSVASAVIKSIDPSSTVVMAGVVDPGMTFFTKTLDLLRSARPRPFDAVAWHAYGAARNLYTNLLALRSALGARGYGAIPIWVTEAGFPASNPNGEARQAAYVLQIMAYGLLGNAARILFYRASDDSTSKQWGLMTRAGQPRMGYVAYQVGSQYLSGITDFVHAPTATAERIIGYASGRAVVLAWSKAASASTIQVPWTPDMQVVDWQGQSAVPADPGGALTVSLPGAAYNGAGVDPKNSVVGGPPVFTSMSTKGGRPLAVQALAPSLPDSSNQVLVVNPAATAVRIFVQSLEFPGRLLPLAIPPESIRSMDTTLLGQNQGVVVKSANDVDVALASGKPGAASVVPAAEWYLPRVPAQVTITNPAAHPITIAVAAYKRAGGPQPSSRMTVQPHGSITVRRYSAGDTLTLTSRNPFAVSGGPAASSARTAWDIVKPSTGKINVYNPQTVSAAVTLTFIGSPALRSELLTLKPHQSFSTGTHGARAITAVSDQSIVAISGGEAPEAANTTAVPLARNDRLAVFNPGTTDAHVSLKVVQGNSVQTIMRVIRPLHVATPVSAKSGSAAVLVSSDLPVVATRGS